MSRTSDSTLLSRYVPWDDRLGITSVTTPIHVPSSPVEAIVIIADEAVVAGSARRSTRTKTYLK